MGVQDSLDQVLAELGNRLTMLKDTGHPNTHPEYNGAPVGTSYRQTDVAPTTIYDKEVAGWVERALPIIGASGRSRYVDPNFVGTSYGSIVSPWKTISDAITDVQDNLTPTQDNPAAVVCAHATYLNPDVVMRQSGVYLYGIGFPTLATTTSVSPPLTLTNATNAASFYTSGDYGTLVNQGDRGASSNIVHGFNLYAGASCNYRILGLLGVKGDNGPDSTYFGWKGESLGVPSIVLSSMYWTRSGPATQVHAYLRNCNYVEWVLGQLGGIEGYNCGHFYLYGAFASKLIWDLDFTSPYGWKTLGSYFKALACDLGQYNDLVSVQGEATTIFDNCTLYDAEGLETALFDIRNSVVIHDTTIAPTAEINTYRTLHQRNLDVQGGSGGPLCSGYDITVGGTFSDPDERVAGVAHMRRQFWVKETEPHTGNGSEGRPYDRLSQALNQIDEDGFILHLQSDVALTSALTIPTYAFTLDAEDWRRHVIDRGTSAIFSITGAGDCTFKNVHFKGELRLNTASVVKLRLANCWVEGRVRISGCAAGSQVLLENSVLTGVVGLRVPLVIGDFNADVIAKDCWFVGSATNAAVQWTSAAATFDCGHFYNCTFVTETGTYTFVRGGSVTSGSTYSQMNTSNKPWQSNITNKLATSGDVTDANVAAKLFV